jgi:metallo-beta-lactamase class B
VNGLVVETAERVILVDTAWNDAQTDEILGWAAEELGRPVTHAVFTHAHVDKMRGVSAVRARGIETFAAADSNVAAVERGFTPAEFVLSFDAAAVSADLAPVIVFDPGGGHTEDNIVVGVPDAEIVFGGCLIRPPGATNLGNTADANMSHWDDAVETVATHFPDALIVVPSHEPPSGRELFELTVRLARERE